MNNTTNKLLGVSFLKNKLAKDQILIYMQIHLLIIVFIKLNFILTFKNLIQNS